MPIGDPIAIGFDPSKRPDEVKYINIANPIAIGWKIQFKLDRKQVGKGTWLVRENRADYFTEQVTVQYINTEEGMRQNFIIHSPLSKRSTLKLNLKIKTKLKSELNGNQLKFFHRKINVLNYEDLHVWDAAGKTLAASFKITGHGKLVIEVNTNDAVYPITIDPISTTPAGMVESNNAGGRMGNSVSSAGDVNGDGYSDVIVGAYFFSNGQGGEGAFYVFHGSATGMNTTPALMVESNQASWQMGYSVSSAGDVNGDGYGDILVGAPFYSNGQSSEGACFIYLGSATGLSSTPALTLEEDNTNARFGQSVAGAGDVNGDGYSDIIVGAPAYTNVEGGEGAFFMFHGSASGINATAVSVVESNQASAQFGWSVAPAGDVNGDGYSDVIMGARLYDNGQTDEGIFNVYHGSGSGINTTPVTSVEGNTNNLYLGYSVAPAGDVNGDGYSDVLVGATGYSNGQGNEGEFLVYPGSASGVSTTASASAESNQVNAAMGNSVGCAGDVNGDGYSDILVGVPGYSNGQSNEGAAFFYPGSASGINPAVNTVLENNLAGSTLGTAVAGAGDVNGDGYSDVVVGSMGYSNVESTEGAAFVFHGYAAGLSTTPNSTPDDADQFAAQFGISIANAGDVNGDGYSDVIIGAWQYDDGFVDEGKAFVYHGSATGLSATPNSTPDDADQAGAWFGESVAGAGDVNGDGYSDVIIGAYKYDDGFVDEGKAFVYHGSAAGLSASPVNTPDDADQLDARFGVSVAGAGDVNGDGYSDVIIGCYRYNDGASTDEGLAFVYHGSATGLSSTPNSTPDDANQTFAQFGYSVAGAGDVNGDGYSDVIIGAFQFDNGQTDEGTAFVYHGSATGISNNFTAMVESNQATAYFGCSVASAGDVNGDGYGDVIVGAYWYDDGINFDEGRAFVYHGSATGIGLSPNSTLDDADLNGAQFGISVAGAGDVNGDGYSDVIIGANLFNDGANTSEGRAFLYYGSSAGLSAGPLSTPDDADQANAWFGYSVASAGDVNGDGYSDVIIGAWQFDDGFSNEGKVFLYNGNELTNNKRNNLRLYNSDLTTNINSSNFIFSNFGAGLFSKSFLGRAKGKMVWETRLNYNAWSGSPITNSTLYTAQQVTYNDMGIAGVELKNLINKIGGGRYTKLRVRIKYDPVTAITGQVFSPWRYVSSIIDANNLGVLPIEMVSFNAAWLQKGRSAKLEFKTDKESGICCFDIEKSLDGFNFTSIGSLPAKNISGIQSYQFTDNNANNNKQFYRIKLKGIGGQIEYSNIQQLQNNGSTEILVFPNPATDVLQLQLNGTYSKMDVQIVNAAGQVVKQLNNLSVSNQSLRIPVNNLSPGRYWLKLQSGNEKQLLQFVKY
ncbi:MAG: FG-GAP repeat protein [Chitinophagaceae bacterium]|nr:FG-GAP repeat protein [Chitinophagaceae bacterium]